MSMNLGESVWKRRNSIAPGVLTPRQYVSALTGFTIYGLLVTSLIAQQTMAWQPQSIWPVLIFGLGIPLIGIFMALGSDDWQVSLIGYTMVVVGIGIIIGPTVAFYKMDIVYKAILATAGVAVACSIIGIIWPHSLENWRVYLFAGLSALLFVRIAQMILGAVYPTGDWYWPAIEYAGALLFSLYIIYDWNRAVRLPHTLDNAVDCALAIYLDIINLFIHLLRIMAHSSSTDD